MPIYHPVDRSYAYVRNIKLCELWEHTKLFYFKQKGAILPASGVPRMSLEMRCEKLLTTLGGSLATMNCHYLLSICVSHKRHNDQFSLEIGKSFSYRSSVYTGNL